MSVQFGFNSETGDLYHGDFWWARDDMERQALHFERRLAEQPASDFYREMARQCRSALREYDNRHREQAA